jgi:hypothetical protein
VLAAAIVALYFFRLAGPGRWIYIVGAVLALYLNVFVGVVQAFQKLPPLAALAPTQSELPFLIAPVPRGSIRPCERAFRQSGTGAMCVFTRSVDRDLVTRRGRRRSRR